MSIVIDLDAETRELLQQRASLLAKMQANRPTQGGAHPQGDEFLTLTQTIQMRLGGLALGQAIAEAGE